MVGYGYVFFKCMITSSRSAIIRGRVDAAYVPQD